MSHEIYKRYRPKTLHDVVGQHGAIKSIEKLIASGNVPHAILLTGPSGTGKTTIARILQQTLRCSPQDFVERNCADFRGIDDIREIRRHSQFAPIGGRCRIFLIDECHKLSNDAQNAILKMLEDTPPHVYFMLATTDPGKLIETIHTRCTEVKLVALKDKDLYSLICEVAGKEKMKLASDLVIDEIVDAADGSARKALVILEQVGCLETEEDQMKAVQSSSCNKDEAITLARLLIRPDTKWGDLAPVLRRLGEQEAESIRYCVLGYCRACMLGKEGKGPNMKHAERAFLVIDIFSSNFYDSKHAGLAAACWEVLHG